MEPWQRPMPPSTNDLLISSEAEFFSAVANLDPNTRLRVGPIEINSPVTINQSAVTITSADKARPVVFKKPVIMLGNDVWLTSAVVKGAGSGNFIEMKGPRNTLVNNVIQGDGVSLGSVGVLSNLGAEQLMYQNVIRGFQHAVYVQNDEVNGVEYLIENYLGDVVPSDNSRSVHAYAESANKVEKISFKRNAIVNGRATIGGSVNATMPLWNIFGDNVFFKADLELAYKRAHATDVTGNWFLHSELKNLMFFGVSEGYQPPAGEVSVVTDNHLYNPGAKQFSFKTSGWRADGSRYDNGEPRIRGEDIWDRNNYYGGFSMYFSAGGNVQAAVTRLIDWQNYSATAGKRFDGAASVTAAAPSAFVAVHVNVYDNDEALLYVWNPQGVSIPVNFGSGKFQVAPVNNALVFGAPVDSFIVTTPLFSAYRLRFVREPEPPPPPSGCIEGVEMAKQARLLLDKWLLNKSAKPVKAARDLLVKAEEKMKDCK